ncbi:MAG: response regulator [Polyangiaceae bacterium]
MDDEPFILKALRRSLERDHQVTCAESGAVALDLVTASPDPFDAIVCDLRMDGMSGEQLYAEISEAAPQLAQCMIFMSGEVWSPRAKRFLDAVPNARFEKPLDLSELRASIRAQLPA